MDERERLILIARAKQKQEAERRAASTNVVEQAGTGTSEGIANVAGMPVDLLTSGINAAGGALGMPPIEKPFGGSESIKGMLSPFMSEDEPQSMAQRIARRVGQDVGGGAVAAPVAGISSLGGLAMNAGSDVASGLAGGLTSEVTDNPYANVLASLLGGAAVPGAAFAMREPEGVPTAQDLKKAAKARYKQVENSEFTLSPDQTQELQGNISARMHDQFMDPTMHTDAAGGVRRVYGMADTAPEGAPSLQNVREAYRWIGDNVLPSQQPGSKGFGNIQREEIRKYLDNAAPDNPDVQAWRQADELTRRYKNADKLEKALGKAERNASKSGVGGNTINATRQAVDRFGEKEAAFLSASEKAMIDKIVKGTTTTNTLRRAGGLAPQRGMLPASFAFGQLAAAGATGNPLYAAPSAIGMVAQVIGEQLTKKQTRDLSRMLRAGKIVTKELSASERAVLQALLATQAAQSQPQ